jgi:hypothetical protein
MKIQKVETFVVHQKLKKPSIFRNGHTNAGRFVW